MRIVFLLTWALALSIFCRPVVGAEPADDLDSNMDSVKTGLEIESAKDDLNDKASLC